MQNSDWMTIFLSPKWNRMRGARNAHRDMHNEMIHKAHQHNMHNTGLIVPFLP